MGISQVLLMLGFCAFMYWIVWEVGSQRFDAMKLHSTSRFDLRHQVAREIAHASTNLIFSLIFTGFLTSYFRPGMTVSEPQGTGTTVLVVVGLILFNELWFYCSHRLLHTRLLFKKIHRIHHESKVVNPFSSYSMHAAEGFMLTAWVFPAILLTNIDVRILIGLQIMGTVNNVISHLGYEFFSPKLLDLPLLRNVNTATFHALHHERVNSNFGLQTRLFDRLFNTECSDYELCFRRKKTAARSSVP